MGAGQFFQKTFGSQFSAVSAKDSKTAWRRYSKHVILYVIKP